MKAAGGVVLHQGTRRPPRKTGRQAPARFRTIGPVRTGDVQVPEGARGCSRRAYDDGKPKQASRESGERQGKDPEIHGKIQIILLAGSIALGAATAVSCIPAEASGPALKDAGTGGAGVDTMASAPAPSPQELAQLVGNYNRWAAGLRSLRAGGRAHVGATGVKSRAFDFSLLLDRPGRARLQGRWGSLATLFDLSGDPGRWTLYLPRDRVVVHTADDSASAGLLLPPGEIISVLLPDGIPPREVDVRGAATIEGDRVRVVVPPGQGGAGSPFHRVLWLDRKDGKPWRLEVRRRSQLEKPILIADYEDYEGKGAEAFPVKVKVTMPADEQWARFDFRLIRINTEVSPDLFRIDVPAGTRELSPDELTPDFLPESDEEG